MDEVFDPFYVAASSNVADYAFGQLFRAPAYYPHQKLDVWRPKDLDVKLGIASDFNIETGAKDAFRRSLPYSSLSDHPKPATDYHLKTGQRE